jgi:eukaryotic-like serine/threonine-protein kinase
MEEDDRAHVAEMSATQTTIGAYRILKPIASGGMGTVYLGEHTLLGRMAAVKLLLPSLSASASLVERFLNEARAVARVADPGIVQIFDFGYHGDGRAFIVMELLEGESVAQRLRRIGRFAPVECLRLARLISTSLAAVHAKRIIHRDLKPANIFIVGDSAVAGGERAKILDFGIAKQTGDGPGKYSTQAGILMGTPMYMSPEQCRGAGDIDHRSDIYSLGCVLFAMLTGQPPFGRGASSELVVAHLHQPPLRAASCVPGIPDVVDDILQRCLKKSPDERFQSMTELVDAIGAAEQALAQPSGNAITAALPGAPAEVTPALHKAQNRAIGDATGVAVRGTREGDASRPGATTLDSASGQSMAHAKRSGMSLRRLAGVVIAASLIGSLGAVVWSRIEHTRPSPAAAGEADAGMPGTGSSEIDAALGAAAPLDAGVDAMVDAMAPLVPADADAALDASPAPVTDPATSRSHRLKRSSKHVFPSGVTGGLPITTAVHM